VESKGFYDIALHMEVLEGEENMRRDYENLMKVEGGQSPALRLYRWSRPTLSIGYSQELLSFPLPTVRRPTGGGALLHGSDISFSYVGLRSHWGGSFSKIYRNFMGVLLDVLKGLLPKLDMSSFRGGYSSYFCYFYPTFGELTIEGKKVVACAMRLMKNAFLIHGSLFLSLDYQLLEKLTGVGERKLKDRIVSLEELNIEEGEVLRVLYKVKEELCPYS
jgi:lipoate-protein ligase A